MTDRPGVTTEQPRPRAGAAGFARTWAATIAGSQLPMERDELITLLTGLTERLAAGLDQTPFDHRHGERIGAELVATHLVTAEGIGRTIELIDSRLLPALGLADGRPEAADGPGRHLRERLARLLGAVTTGYAQALRDRTLDEQESIRGSALLAREQAQRALRESEARFRYQATHDPLTDLANRTLFTEQLAARFARGEGGVGRVGICFVDLDGFKMVNDTLGHHIGDLLLTAVADRLRHRLPDQLVARLGGDEFVILLEDTTCPDDVIKVADAALAAIGEPAQVAGHELTISASVGIVERALGDTSPSELMRAADVTLYWAKSAGKGRWALFDPVRNQQELARYALSAAMPAAVDKDEFFLEYQPLVSLHDGAVIGIEALARWRHPERGVLYPDQFLGLAEETGVIIRLGRRLLAEACRQARTWQQQLPGPPFVSVNLTARQVRDPELVGSVTAVLDQVGLAPGRLQLEITEQALAGPGTEQPVRALHQLAELGVRIAIDDFGTGYCHLAHLRKLPVCDLKLGGPFVKSLREPDAGDGTDERILANLVSLAHTLGLTVTAEEVETATQGARLRAIGCDAAQGWQLGGPTSPDRLTARLSR